MKYYSTLQYVLQRSFSQVSLITEMQKSFKIDSNPNNRFGEVFFSFSFFLSFFLSFLIKILF